jgi:hypothetical protein
MTAQPAVTLDHGLANVRDVGGLPVAGGGVIRSGVLFRSDAPLAGEPDPHLTPWPPRLVIDLRSPEESAAAHPLVARGAVVRSVPLLSQADPAKLAASPGGITLAGLYAAMIDSAGDLVVQVIETMLAEPGPCLVHCAVGKDRTGVVVAIMLAVAGVSRADIVADYELSGPNMAAVLDRVVKTRPADEQEATRFGLDQVPAHLFAADAAAIEAVVDTVTGAGGGVTGWLESHGLAPDSVDALRRRLVDLDGLAEPDEIGP